MSGSNAAPSQAAAARPAIGSFERYLTVWVALCIVLGIALGLALPGLFSASAAWNTLRSTCPSGC